MGVVWGRLGLVWVNPPNTPNTLLARCSPNIPTNNEQTTHELPLTHPQAASKQFCSFFTHLGGTLGCLGKSRSLFLCCFVVLQASVVFPTEQQLRYAVCSKVEDAHEETFYCHSTHPDRSCPLYGRNFHRAFR